MRYTPGPWTIKGREIFDSRHGLVAEAWSGIPSYLDRAADRQAAIDANACLLAAAPELVGALKYAVDNPEFDSAEFDRIARAALTKAGAL